MKILVVLILATSFVRIQGVRVCDKTSDSISFSGHVEYIRGKDLKNIRLRLSTRFQILCAFKTFHSGERIKKLGIRKGKRLKGVPILEEDFLEDGSGSPTPPSQPSPPSSCGVRPTSGARIVGGKETQKNSIPWQAMLRTDYAQFCGGSLIHPQWVLTAAHCIVGETTGSFKIWLGAHRREVKEDTTQEFNVIQIVKHENYSSRTMENDMALIKLDRPAILGPGVGLVCLGDDKYHLPLDDLTNQCLISGWGTLRFGGSQPDKLQEVTVPLVSPSECQKAYGNMHSSMLCAGFKEGGMDTCQGDSGGPLVCQYSGKHFLEGATSFGNGCAAPNSYGVYSKVRYLRKFIDDTIQA